MHKHRYTYIVIDIHNDRDTIIGIHDDILIDIHTDRHTHAYTDKHAYRHTGRLTVTLTDERRDGRTYINT